ncbi:MAG: hypothetical protein PHD72_03050 [Patescibacteria group bacterium]|nr:hypothetical protein [Patescibacteria group bacterium]
MGERYTIPNSVSTSDGKYKHVKNSDTFLAGDAFRARFLDVKQAVANNPEKRGVSSSILAACYMTFGPERVDLKKLGTDVLLPRLNGYLVAYNDQVDIAEKIETSDPDVYKIIMDYVNKYKDKLNEYFKPTGDEKEDSRRQKFKQFYDLAFDEVNSIEHELFTVKKPDSPKTDDCVTTREIERIQHGRELVNAIEMLMNIRACVGSDIFTDRKIDQAGSKDIGSLAIKYNWIIDQNYPDTGLTKDERKARMLFFATMSNQCALDELDYKEDRCFDIWKKMTYMTEIQNLPPKDAARVIQQDTRHYAALAGKHGVSLSLISAANKGARLFSNLKNIAHISDNARDFIARKAEESGHIREKAVNILKRKHPEKYKL